MSKDLDSLFSEDIDDLFSDDQTLDQINLNTNIMVFGGRSSFNRIRRNADQDRFNVVHTESIDDAVVLLLQELFGLIFIDNDHEEVDVIAVSRVLRINHPLARIVALSRKRGSRLISNIINHGSVDAFLKIPSKSEYITNLIEEQIAKHEIAKMLTSFVSQPPKLSKASYLLLDPTLSFGDENEPVKFVGVMMAYKSVPRYNKFFEEVLAKDEILFSGYLSGVAMLGRELFTSKEPLKEINFGGVSVIFRFYEDLQVSIFVRNLTRHNIEFAENTITTIIDELMEKRYKEICGFDLISDEGFAEITEIISKFEETSEAEAKHSNITISDDQIPLLIVSNDKKTSRDLRKFLERRRDYVVNFAQNQPEIYDAITNKDCGVVLLDTRHTDNNTPLVLAEYCKEISPSIQILYRVRDRRASAPLIQALNSGFINYIVPYKASMKYTSKWVGRAIEKAKEIKKQSLSGEGIDQSLDQMTIARTMIRKNEGSYMPDMVPELHGVFIFQNLNPIFQILWDQYSTKLEFDEEMMAGLVSSLDSIGGEMSLGGVGGLELGGAKIVVHHKDDVTITFFVKNMDPNTSVVINKELDHFAQIFFGNIEGSPEALVAPKMEAKFKNLANQISIDFNEKFTIN